MDPQPPAAPLFFLRNLDLRVLAFPSSFGYIWRRPPANAERGATEHRTEEWQDVDRDRMHVHHKHKSEAVHSRDAWPTRHEGQRCDCVTQVRSGQVSPRLAPRPPATRTSRGKMMLLSASPRPLATGVPIHEEHFRTEPAVRSITLTQENEKN